MDRYSSSPAKYKGAEKEYKDEGYDHTRGGSGVNEPTAHYPLVRDRTTDTPGNSYLSRFQSSYGRKKEGYDAGRLAAAYGSGDDVRFGLLPIPSCRLCGRMLPSGLGNCPCQSTRSNYLN